MIGAFETSRLKATPLAREDLPDLVALHLDPDVSRFLGGVRSADATARYLETNLGHWTDHGVGLWTIRTHNGAFLGRAGLRYIDLEGVQEFEVAYSFIRDAWGKGIGTEVAGALVEIWKTQRPEPSLVGLVLTGNLASERVLLRAGLALERHAMLPAGECGVFRRTRAAAPAA